MTPPATLLLALAAFFVIRTPQIRRTRRRETAAPTERTLPVGIFGSFKQAKQTIEDAKKDVRRPRDEVADKRAQKGNGKQK